MKDRLAYLGFPVQVLGRDGLKSFDARRWQGQPYLLVSLAICAICSLVWKN